MAGYFGTEAQQRLQAKVEASIDFINETPGACQAGRTMSCDDPDRLGWERIAEFLTRDGVCGFRLIPSSKVDELRSQLMRRGFRFDTWDVFLADRATALAASMETLSRGLPDGFVEMDRPTHPESEYMRRVQALMDGAGVVPFSGSLLAGAFGPATTIVVGDTVGTIAAAAHGYMPHNVYSAYHRYAWGGLVVVSDEQRGKRLGTYVNARMVASVFHDLKATHVYELVSATNFASRRMVEASGLFHEPTLACGFATPHGAARLTR